MSDWTDRIVGDRMAVDREFSERISASEFSSQEWGMIMTAVEFEIENPETPSEATLYANTEKIDQIMPALDEVGGEMSAMGGAPGGGGGSSSSGGGLFDTVKSALGFGDGSADEERITAAEALADEYAQQLQDRLEEHGKWTTACEAAAAGSATGAGLDGDASDDTDTDTTGNLETDDDR
jgi:hypothetical protein